MQGNYAIWLYPRAFREMERIYQYIYETLQAPEHANEKESGDAGGISAGAPSRRGC